jgi:tubulin polyglutamylase TTLL6/13
MKSTLNHPNQEITEDESELENEEINNESSESEDTKESESDEVDGTSDDISSDENYHSKQKNGKNKISKNNKKIKQAPAKLIKKETLFINVANTRYPIIKEAAKGLGYRVTYKEEKDWDIIWYD